MINPSRENLLGYLVGALEDDERAVVEDALAVDLRLRDELELLGRSLAVVEADRGHYDPPPSLALRTCQYVYQQTAVVPAALSPVRAGETVPYRRWSFADVSVAAGIFLAASLLMVPAIYSSRTSAQAARCQYNLSRIGVALKSYSERDKSRMFPLVPLSGKLARGEIFGPMLLERKMINPEEENVFFCAGDEKIQNKLTEEVELSIPRLHELEAATGASLLEKQDRLGSYAISMGYTDENGQYQGIKDRSRANFALLSDAPADHCTGSDNHGGCGFNVLYEDGSVRYRKNCQEENGDHIFKNGLEQVAPGVDSEDAVIVRQAPTLLPLTLISQ